MSDKHENETGHVRSLSAAFGIVTFKTGEGQERSLRTDQFSGAAQYYSDTDTCHVHYVAGNSIDSFQVKHTVAEVNRMVAKAHLEGLQALL